MCLQYYVDKASHKSYVEHLEFLVAFTLQCFFADVYILNVNFEFTFAGNIPYS
jgi:hypothetical protein